jgi:ATP-dependent Clp protease protease subunit
MSRLLTLSDEITEKSVKDIITSIQDWNLQDNENDKKQKDFKREPIHFMINSCGGDMYSSMGVSSMIKVSKTPIYTYCIGEALSGGFLMFIHGHKRFCYEGSSFLYHQASCSLWYKTLTQQLNSIEEKQKIEKRYEKMILDNTKITEEQINEYNEKNLDWWISPDEALELGIVDEIIK